MSWWYTAATVAAGAISENAKRKGRYGNADERDRAARESLLTAKYNIKERTKESRQTQFQVLETGGNLTRQIAIEGKRAEGAAAVSGATSGALVETGSTRAALTNIMQESLSAQTDAILDTKNRIKAISRDTTNRNTSEWRNAKLNEKQQSRVADQERKAADREYLAGMINTGVKAYGAYETSSAWNKKSPSIDTKTTTTGSSIRPAGMTEGPRNRYLKAGTGPVGKYTSVSPSIVSKSITSKNVTPMKRIDQHLQKATPKKMKSYSMDKVRPTSGSESSKLYDRAIAKFKRSSFDPSGLLDWSRIKHAFGFTKGRVNLGKLGRTYNFFSGK